MRDDDAVLAAWYAGEVGGEALFWLLAHKLELTGNEARSLQPIEAILGAPA
jgi:hypothetical protein